MPRAVRSRVGEAVTAGGALLRRVGEIGPVHLYGSLAGGLFHSVGDVIPLPIAGQELRLIGDAPVRADLEILGHRRSLLRHGIRLLSEQCRGTGTQCRHRQHQCGGTLDGFLFHGDEPPVSFGTGVVFILLCGIMQKKVCSASAEQTGRSAHRGRTFLDSGHMYATDVDPEESAKTRKRLEDLGFGEDLLILVHVKQHLLLLMHE